MTAPGWYQAEGDPAGTTRYWDGAQWVGDPVVTPVGPQDTWASSPSSPGSDLSGSTSSQHVPSAALASPGSRIGARLIDFVIFAVIALVLLFPVITDVIDGIGDLPAEPSQAQIEAVFDDAIDGRDVNLLLAGLVGWALEIFLIAFAGGTVGKLMLGLRIRVENTGAMPPGLPKAFLRTLNRTLAVIVGLVATQSAANALQSIAMLVGLISLVMLFTDSRHRTVMDRIAGTVVTRK